MRTDGPAYRRAGASAVFADDGRAIGAISGGCLEEDLKQRAAEVLRGGPPQLVAYNTGAEEDLLWGTGTGCGGRVEVLLAPVADDLLAEVERRLNLGSPVHVSTVIEPGPDLGRRFLHPDVGAGAGGAGEAGGTGLAWESGENRDPGATSQGRPSLAWGRGVSGEPGCLRPGAWVEGRLFHQVITPPITLLLCGAGNDAIPVASLAAAIGFRVVVVDHRPAALAVDRFPAASGRVLAEPADLPDRLAIPPGAYVVLLTHHYGRDLAYLKLFLSLPTGYLGLLGSRTRAARLLRHLEAEAPALAAEAVRRLRSPVGLAIGADGPEEIAVAIVAELIAARAGRLDGTSAPDRGCGAPTGWTHP